MNSKKIPTPTISEILKEEFLNPLEITAYKLSKDIHVSTSTILDILHGRRKISIEMSLRLSKYFGTSDKFWINIQTDLDIREQKEKLKKELNLVQKLKKIA